MDLLLLFEKMVLNMTLIICNFNKIQFFYVNMKFNIFIFIHFDLIYIYMFFFRSSEVTFVMLEAYLRISCCSIYCLFFSFCFACVFDIDRFRRWMNFNIIIFLFCFHLYIYRFILACQKLIYIDHTFRVCVCVWWPMYKSIKWIPHSIFILHCKRKRKIIILNRIGEKVVLNCNQSVRCF